MEERLKNTQYLDWIKTVLSLLHMKQDLTEVVPERSGFTSTFTRNLISNNDVKEFSVKTTGKDKMQVKCTNNVLIITNRTVHHQKWDKDTGLLESIAIFLDSQLIRVLQDAIHEMPTHFIRSSEDISPIILKRIYDIVKQANQNRDPLSMKGNFLSLSDESQVTRGNVQHNYVKNGNGKDLDTDPLERGSDFRNSICMDTLMTSDTCIKQTESDTTIVTKRSATFKENKHLDPNQQNALSKDLERFKHLICQKEKDDNHRDLKILQWNLLIAAITYDDLGIVEYLYDTCKEDMIRLVDTWQRNAAHYAAIKDRLQILKYLLETVKMDPCVKSSHKLSILHLATLNENTDIVEYICQNLPCLMNEKDVIGRTAAHMVAQKDNLPILKLLIKNEADAYVPAGDGSTLLHIAASHKSPAMVEYLCQEQNFDSLYTSNKLGMYPVHFAARCSLDVLVFLLDKGVRPVVQTNNGATILHGAAHHGKEEIVKYLCTQYEELIWMTDKGGFSPAYYSARRGHLTCLQILLNFGTSREMYRSKNGWTISHTAARNGRFEIVKWLCEKYNSLVSETDNDQWTAAHHAAKEGQLQCLEYLCQDNMISPLATDNEGWTILHTSCYFGRPNVVEWICENFAALIALEDNEGLTASDRALQTEHLDCRAVLKRYMH